MGFINQLITGGPHLVVYNLYIISNYIQEYISTYLSYIGDWGLLGLLVSGYSVPLRKESAHNSNETQLIWDMSNGH